MAETRFHTLLRVKIEALRRDRVEDLIKGTADSKSAYRAQVSYIQALDDVLGLCQETERDFDA